GIAKIELDAQINYQNQTSSLEIMLVTEGGAVINNQLVLKRGEAAALFANETYQLTASGHSTLFKSFVPL
ncbi:MAG: hypothetical protein B7Y69_12935, partial [Sphingobacteriia bacterium 35-40-8]